MYYYPGASPALNCRRAKHIVLVYTSFVSLALIARCNIYVLHDRESICTVGLAHLKVLQIMRCNLYLLSMENVRESMCTCGL